MYWIQDLTSCSNHSAGYLSLFGCSYNSNSKQSQQDLNCLTVHPKTHSSCIFSCPSKRAACKRLLEYMFSIWFRNYLFIEINIFVLKQMFLNCKKSLYWIFFLYWNKYFCIEVTIFVGHLIKRGSRKNVDRFTAKQAPKAQAPSGVACSPGKCFQFQLHKVPFTFPGFLSQSDNIYLPVPFFFY